MPQGSSCGCRKRGKTELRRAFPALDGVRPRANPICPFASHSLRGADAGAGSGRTAFRDGRQNVAETSSRLSSCIPLGARGSRISVCFHPAPRLRGSRRGCPDVLTKCHWGLAAVRSPFGTFTTGRPPKHCKEVSEGHFPSRPGIAEIYGCPHRISTEPLFVCRT